MKGINKGFTGLKLKVESYFVEKNVTIFYKWVMFSKYVKATMCN